MSLLQIILISLVALLHLGFMLLEMIYWDKKLGRRIFRTSREFASESKFLAMNQGLYNGFLTAGLIWGLLQGDEGIRIVIFFLICVIIAGLFGALTVNRRVFFIQALPAIIALLALLYL